MSVIVKGIKLGETIGFTGSSYGIPVRGYNNKLLPLDEIELYVEDFIDYVEDNPHVAFIITPVGCEQTMLNAPSISNLFKDAPKNCIFDRRWKFWLGNSVEYQE